MKRKYMKSSRRSSKISRRLEIKYDIDGLLKWRRLPEFRLQEGEKELDKLFKKYGNELFDDIIKRMDEWEKSEHTALLWILSYLGNEKLIEKLWGYLERPKKSFKPRLTALSLLQDMGEDIHQELKNIQNISLDVDKLESIMSESIHIMLDTLHTAKGSDQIQNILFQLYEMKEESFGGEEFLHFLIDATSDRMDERSADFLLAMSLVLPIENVRRKAKEHFQKLRFKGYEPTSPYVLALEQNRLFKVYYEREKEGNTTQLSLAWERENDLLQVYVFLLDSTDILDFFVTQNISKNRFEKEFFQDIEESKSTVMEFPTESAVHLIKEYFSPVNTQKQNLPESLFRFSHVLQSTIDDIAETA
ncbi:MAG: hypothetical protein B6244_05565 [Candidatus Cloacimonetes bacterium 4572_55]|nr:MAG: hypothetical protein B6244_05565 [Candidatus Cloacimonetes bacterium 4572_55]